MTAKQAETQNAECRMQKYSAKRHTNFPTPQKPHMHTHHYNQSKQKKPTTHAPSRSSKTQPVSHTNTHKPQSYTASIANLDQRILDAALSAGMPFHTFAHERLCVSLSLPPKRRCAGSLPHLTSVPRFRLFKWGGKRERRRVRGKMSSGLALVPVVAG